MGLFSTPFIVPIDEVSGITQMEVIDLQDNVGQKRKIQ